MQATEKQLNYIKSLIEDLSKVPAHVAPRMTLEQFHATCAHDVLTDHVVERNARLTVQRETAAAAALYVSRLAILQKNFSAAKDLSQEAASHIIELLKNSNATVAIASANSSILANRPCRVTPAAVRTHPPVQAKIRELFSAEAVKIILGE